MNGKIICIFILLIAPLAGFSQSAEASFHIASNQFIHGKMQQAQMTLDAALARYPNDQKLRELREQIKEQEEQNQPQNENKDEQQNNENKEGGESKEKDENGKDKENPNSEKEEEQKEGDQKEQQADQQPQDEKAGDKQKNEEQKRGDPNLDRDKLDNMKISEAKARMILEAMRNQEKQYLQQNVRKGTQPKDRSKPDW